MSDPLTNQAQDAANPARVSFLQDLIARASAELAQLTGGAPATDAAPAPQDAAEAPPAADPAPPAADDLDPEPSKIEADLSALAKDLRTQLARIQWPAFVPQIAEVKRWAEMTTGLVETILDELRRK